MFSKLDVVCWSETVIFWTLTLQNSTEFLRPYDSILLKTLPRKTGKGQRLCGKAASGLKRILCELLVKRTPEKHG